jgi:hypothetical protein
MSKNALYPDSITLPDVSAVDLNRRDAVETETTHPSFNLTEFCQQIEGTTALRVHTDPTLPLMLVSGSTALKIHELVFLQITCRSLSQTIRPIITNFLAQFEPKIPEDDDDYITHADESGKEGVNPTQIHLYTIAKVILNPSCDNVNSYFQVGTAGQGGPIFATALHVAAQFGEFNLCHVLVELGANINANIFIPNDQDSNDESQDACNRADGSDFSQYRWGLITPLRVARLFRHRRVAQMLLENHAVHGRTQITSIPTSSIGSIFSSLGRPGFQSLRDDACWTDENRTEIYYLNTYMNGQRVYPGILFSRQQPADT